MISDIRNRLLHYSRDISELAEEVRLCQNDLERQIDGPTVHYAVDTNILFFGVSPHRESDLGKVFYDDGVAEARTLALSLRRFLFEKISSFERPFLISHGHDAEARWAFEKMLLRGVHDHIELEDELNDISVDFAARLTKASDPAAVFEQVLPRLTRLLAYDDGPNQDYRRFIEIVEDGRVQRLSLAFSRSKHFTDIFKAEPELYKKFSVPRTIRDQLSETKHRHDWHAHLIAAGVQKHPYAMRCDIAALARIQLINEQLEETGHKVVLITADNGIIEASKTVTAANGYAFRDLYVRHPKAFLAAQSVLAPDQEHLVDSDVSSTITLLDDWIQLLSDMMPALENLSQSNGGEQDYRAQFDELADNIKEGWREHVATLEEAHASTSNMFRDMISQISTFDDDVEVMTAIKDAAKRKVAEVHDTWTVFFEQVLSTSYLVFEHSTMPIRPRNVPPIYFGSFNSAYETIRRISGSLSKELSLEDIHALDGSDDGGYTCCLCFSALFASLGRWQTAELVANQALQRATTAATTLDNVTGREAYYVRAISQRLQAGSPNQLLGARKSLQHSEVCLDNERNGKSREWLRLRYRSEEAAIDLAEILFETYSKNQPETGALRDRVSAICVRIADALKATNTIEDDWIKTQVIESLLTNLFIGAGILKSRKERDEFCSRLINELVPRYAEYLTSEPNDAGILKSFVGRVYFLFARCFYFPATSQDCVRMQKELSDLSHYYSEYRPLKVMPYDDERFEQLFEIISQELSRIARKTV